MKYYKTTLGKNEKGLVYPANYQVEIGDMAVDHLYWDEGIQTYLLLCIPDSKSAGIVRTNVMEITEVEAKAISESNEIRTEVILDEVKLRRIELKATLGQALTIDETDSIDITKPESIFKVTKILADR